MDNTVSFLPASVNLFEQKAFSCSVRRDFVATLFPNTLARCYGFPFTQKWTEIQYLPQPQESKEHFPVFLVRKLLKGKGPDCKYAEEGFVITTRNFKVKKKPLLKGKLSFNYVNHKKIRNLLS